MRLVVLHAEDLTPKTMRRHVQGLLPLRDLTGQEHLIACLEEESATYQEEVWRGPLLPVPVTSRADRH